MWVLDVEEMKSSSKIDVLWWMSMKDAYKPRVPIIDKISKLGCISLATKGRPFHATHKHDLSKCGPPST
jgi:hypothetical protein